MKFVGLLVFSNLFKYALFQQSGIYLPVAADSAWWIAHLYIQSFLHQINKQEENYLSFTQARCLDTTTDFIQTRYFDLM